MLNSIRGERKTKKNSYTSRPVVGKNVNRKKKVEWPVGPFLKNFSRTRFVDGAKYEALAAVQVCNVTLVKKKEQKIFL